MCFSLSKIAAQRGFLSGQLVRLVVKLSEDAVTASTTGFPDGGTLGKMSLQRRIHTHEMPCREESGNVVIGVAKSQEQCETLLYPYPSITGSDVPTEARRLLQKRLLRIGYCHNAYHGPVDSSGGGILLTPTVCCGSRR